MTNLKYVPVIFVIKTNKLNDNEQTNLHIKLNYENVSTLSGSFRVSIHQTFNIFTGRPQQKL